MCDEEEDPQNSIANFEIIDSVNETGKRQKKD